MDLFINRMDLTKFRFTNAVWNELTLNSPWSIGYVSNLISSRNFLAKEEWEKYYYDSGKERNELFLKLKLDISEINSLNDLYGFNNVRGELKYLNFNFGRTKHDLDFKAQLLYNKIKNYNPHNISLNECKECVRFRIICETWNGIVMREMKTIEKMNFLLDKNCKLVSTSGEKDYKYGVDYELYENEELICGLQIKPITYKSSKSRAVQKARNANKRKNILYKQDFGKDVCYVYSKSNGSIIEIDGDILKSYLDNL
jgi:hypothetical protein